MAKATALDKVRRVRQRPKPKSQSAQIGPDGPKHPGNRQLYDKRGRPDAGARLYADYPNPKVATFCAALWLTFTLPLTTSLFAWLSPSTATQRQPKFPDVTLADQFNLTMPVKDILASGAPCSTQPASGSSPRRTSGRTCSTKTAPSRG